MSVVTDSQRIERYYDGSDGTLSFEVVRKADLERIERVTAREAIKALKADRMPSGNLTVISDQTVSDLLTHEAMSHATEGAKITKRRSFFTGAIDRKMVSDIITMYDNGTVRGAHGSVSFDDEKTPLSCTTIIDHGVYMSYIYNLETTSQLGTKPTGNGGAEDHEKRV